METTKRCTKIVAAYVEAAADHPWVVAGFRQAGDRVRVCTNCQRPVVMSMARGVRGRLEHVK